MKIMKYVMLLSVVLISACANNKKMTEADALPETVMEKPSMITDLGKVKVTFSDRGQWESLESTATANVSLDSDVGIEQSMNLATLRAKRNIVEFIETEITASKTTETFVDTLVKQQLSVDAAANLTSKVTESIKEDSSGIIRGAYISDRKLLDKTRTVSVTVVVDRKTLAVSSMLRAQVNR